MVKFAVNAEGYAEGEGSMDATIKVEARFDAAGLLTAWRSLPDGEWRRPGDPPPDSPFMSGGLSITLHP